MAKVSRSQFLQWLVQNVANYYRQLDNGSGHLEVTSRGVIEGATLTRDIISEEAWTLGNELECSMTLFGQGQ